MPTLTVLSGLPGAGKSTLARKVVAETGAVLLSRDELRKAMTNCPDDYLLTYILLEVGEQLLQAGLSVVVDAWNLHHHDRTRWERVATITRSRLEWCHVNTPLEECIRRDASRPEPNGEERVRAVAAEFGLQ